MRFDSQLANLLHTHAEALTRRWTDELRMGIAPNATSEPELRDHIPDLLRDLVSALHSGRAPDESTTARLHGVLRHCIGFNLEAVVREYELLQKLILDLAAEASCPVTLAEMRVVIGFFGTAISAGVSEHGRCREHEDQALHAKVAAEQRKLYDLFMQAPLPVCILEGPAHTFVFANPKYRELVGGRDIVGKPLLEALPEVKEQDFAALLDSVVSTGEPAFAKEVEMKLAQDDDAEPAILNFVYQPKRNAAAEVDGVMVCGFDVSAQVRARERVEALADELQKSEERLRLATHASRVGVWELDLATLKAWRSELHDRAFGYDTMLPEWSFHTFLEHIHPQDRDRVRTDMERAMDQRGAFEVDFRVRWPDATWHWMTASGRIENDASGRPVRMVGTNTDITDRKRLEADARDRSAFERQLIGIVSHDLRTPLSAILLGAASVLRREELSERTTKALLLIQSAAERATRLVKDLLDFTQARLGGGIPLRREPLDLHAFTRLAVEEVAANFPEREIEVACQGEGQGEWDGDRLAQVVSNLVTNAVKYSPEGSRVTVHTHGQGDWLELTVHNGGALIPPEALGRLFEPMQRVAAHVDTASRSVGLGLYIVKHIVDAHGGTVEVRSTDAGGTTLTVRLPRKPREGAKEQLPRPPEP